MHPQHPSGSGQRAVPPSHGGLETGLATPAVRAHSSEGTYLQALSVDKHLSHRLAPQVDVLDLFGCDVLSLCQLKYVLLPVDDLQGPVLPSREEGCEWPGWPPRDHTLHRALCGALVPS